MDILSGILDQTFVQCFRYWVLNSSAFPSIFQGINYCLESMLLHNEGRKHKSRNSCSKETLSSYKEKHELRSEGIHLYFKVLFEDWPEIQFLEFLLNDISFLLSPQMVIQLQSNVPCLLLLVVLFFFLSASTPLQQTS